MLVSAATDASLDHHAVWEALQARGLVARPVRKEESASFLKKRSKKLFLLGAADLSTGTSPGERPTRPDQKKFFAYFFRKRRAFFLASPRADLACLSCDLISPAREGEACPRCGAALHRRKPASLNRAWALLIAAAVLYIPANTFPVLTLIEFGRGNPSTILGGVQQLVAAHLWSLAILVFVASITVPVLKILGLTVMLLSVHGRMASHLRDRTLLYRVVDLIGRWSMIDVFMISILTGLVRLGFLADVRPGIGAMAFASVVILTMLAAFSFDPRLMWDVANRNAPPAT